MMNHRPWIGAAWGASNENPVGGYSANGARGVQFNKSGEV